MVGPVPAGVLTITVGLAASVSLASMVAVRGPVPAGDGLSKAMVNAGGVAS